ncbi:MAG TPA: SGNH family hydrolase [Afipia sp.]
MPSNKPLRRILAESGPLTVFAVAIALTLGIAAPASAQFFNFGGPPPPPRGGGFYSPFGDTFGPTPPPQRRIVEDSSRAPPAAKRDTPAERNVLVLGDAMADWLAYGLEDALSETPELGVIRKHKTVSGLIKYQPKGDPVDWPAAAKGILATEKPDVIVVMLGLNDRIPIKEPEKKAEAKPADKDKDVKGAKKDARGKPGAKPGEADAAKTIDKPDDEKNLADRAASQAPEADAASDDDDDKPAAAPDKTARSASGMSDFRDERWVELYTRKVEEMIAVLKTKGVPILWVGLPAVRGTKATSDMLFLNALYRDVAGKTGVTYVDVWDGFVDEAGRFLQQGPDFEGQIRRLRSSDGVFFTKAGARKLAHYTEREIHRVLASRTPLALPTESAPDNNALVNPGIAGPRPLAGPVVPLVASSVGTDELLGGAGTRPASVDALASRTLVKGEALAAPAGRADDFAWPRREVGTLDVPASAMGDNAGSVQDGASGATAAKKKRAPQNPARGFFDPGRMLPPRPPGTVGRSAEMPGFFR